MSSSRNAWTCAAASFSKRRASREPHFRRREVRRLPAGIYRYIATVESVLGWLLRALFLVSLGRTMIR